MTSPTVTGPSWGGNASMRRLSVPEFHRMVQAGIFEEDDPFELLEGYLVLKMPRNPPHDSTIQRVQRRLFQRCPAGWDVRIQCAVTLSDSEPEPDLVVVRGDESDYRSRHPGPADIGLVVEVADTSLDRDRTDKARVYARAGLPAYWVVNLVDGQLEVFTGPSGPTVVPAYAQQQVLRPGADAPLLLDGAQVGTIPVSELLP
jgi:Uma2 family endonuclease